MFLGQEMHYYMVYILHIVLNFIYKFAITRKNDAFVAKIATTRRTKFFMAILVLNERLPTSSTTLQSGNASFVIIPLSGRLKRQK